MDLTTLTTSTLKSITGLTDKLSATIDELKKIEQTILASLSNEAPAAPAKRGPKPKAAAVKVKAPAKKVEVKAPVAKAPKAGKAPKVEKAPVAAKTPVAAKSGKKGGVKEQIVALLEKAGAKGISVKDIAEKLDVKPGNIHVWFATTGKSVGVDKVAPGVYRLKA